MLALVDAVTVGCLELTRRGPKTVSMLARRLQHEKAEFVAWKWYVLETPYVDCQRVARIMRDYVLLCS